MTFSQRKLVYRAIVQHYLLVRKPDNRPAYHKVVLGHKKGQHIVLSFFLMQVFRPQQLAK
jgi:hypothetical protein